METNNRFSSYIYKIFCSEIILGLVIIISILVVKYFFKGTYTDFKKWYTQNVQDNTYISEVIEGKIDEN